MASKSWIVTDTRKLLVLRSMPIARFWKPGSDKPGTPYSLRPSDGATDAA